MEIWERIKMEGKSAWPGNRQYCVYLDIPLRKKAFCAALTWIIFCLGNASVLWWLLGRPAAVDPVEQRSRITKCNLDLGWLRPASRTTSSYCVFCWLIWFQVRLLPLECWLYGSRAFCLFGWFFYILSAKNNTCDMEVSW